MFRFSSAAYQLPPVLPAQKNILFSQAAGNIQLSPNFIHKTDSLRILLSEFLLQLNNQKNNQLKIEILELEVS